MPSMELGVVKSARAPKLVDVVAQKVSELIIARELRPGDPLPKEHELSSAYGVSRSVVREAMVELKVLGVVEIKHGLGAFVGSMPVELLLTRVRRLEQDPEAILKEMWEVREVIEAAIAEFAAERRTDSDLQSLAGAVAAMDKAIAAGDTGEQMVTGIANLIEPSRHRSLERPGRPVTSNEEHRVILGAVRDQDPRRAKSAMRTHLINGRLLTTKEPGL